MNNHEVPLNQLPLGYRGKVKRIDSEGQARRRILDLGLIPDTEIEALQKSPSGDPTAYRFRGAVIALRSEEASYIILDAMENTD